MDIANMKGKNIFDHSYDGLFKPINKAERNRLMHEKSQSSYVSHLKWMLELKRRHVICRFSRMIDFYKFFHLHITHIRTEHRFKSCFNVDKRKIGDSRKHSPRRSSPQPQRNQTNCIAFLAK